MKKSLLIILAIFSVSTYAVETQKVCHDKVVKGKTTQVCKQVKIHQKLSDATVVPTKKK